MQQLRRAPKKISNESELFLRKWVAYFESVNCELKFTPSAGCSVQYKKRKIGQLKPPDRKGLIEFLILRSSKRGYKKPAIKGVNVSNIIKYAPDDGPSYVLPWGKELFKVSETQELIDLHENHLKTFIEEAIETVDGNNVLASLYTDSSRAFILANVALAILNPTGLSQSVPIRTGSHHMQN